MQDVLLVRYLTTSAGNPSQILVVVIRMAGMAGRPMDPRVSFRLVERLTHLWGVVQHCAHGQRSTGRLANLRHSNLANVSASTNHQGPIPHRDR